jgi:hypothetical protein
MEPDNASLLTPSHLVIKHNYLAQESKKSMGNAASAATGPSELLGIEQSGAVLTVDLNRGAERQGGRAQDPCVPRPQDRQGKAHVI